LRSELPEEEKKGRGKMMMMMTPHRIMMMMMIYCYRHHHHLPTEEEGVRHTNSRLAKGEVASYYYSPTTMVIPHNVFFAFPRFYVYPKEGG